MKIESFIGASSAVLIAWLGATYFHKLPTERYHQQLRSTSPVTGEAGVVTASGTVAGNEEATR